MTDLLDGAGNTGAILDGALGIALLLVSAALLMSLARLVIGPDKPDRILALDTLYVNTIALLVLFSMHLGNDLFFEAALLIALLGFIGTVALAKFLTRGDIIE
jgi:multicomponent K+:H+ antiporter subunit F